VGSIAASYLRQYAFRAVKTGLFHYFHSHKIGGTQRDLILSISLQKIAAALLLRAVLQPGPGICIPVSFAVFWLSTKKMLRATPFGVESASRSAVQAFDRGFESPGCMQEPTGKPKPLQGNNLGAQAPRSRFGVVMLF